MDTNKTTPSPSTVVGYFSSRSNAERAVHDLKDAGFTSDQIGIATRPPSDRADRNTATAPDITSSVPGTQPADSPGTVRGTAENAGEKVRGAWDKIVDFFEGRSHDRADDRIGNRADYNRSSYQTETNAVPRSTEPSPAVAGTAAAPGTSPSTNPPSDSFYDYEGEEFEGSLNDLQVPQERSRYFRHQFDRSKESTVVTVSAPGRENEAEAILSRNGADLGSNAADYTYSTAETPADNYPQRIQLLGEALRVHKQRISRGDVRLRKQVVSDTQTVQVPVTREELVIERSEGTQAPINAQIGESGEIRVPLSEEKVTVEKQPYVREEVSVGKRTVSDVQQFEERVRREELEVDKQTDRRTA